MSKIHISVSLEEELVKQIDQIAEAEDVRRSWIVQRVLAGWLERYEAPRPIAPRAPGSQPPGVGRRPLLRKTAGDLEAAK